MIALEHIRQATGGNNLEMVLKLVNQSANHTILEEEKCEAESKVARGRTRDSRARRPVEWVIPS